MTNKTLIHIFLTSPTLKARPATIAREGDTIALTYPAVSTRLITAVLEIWTVLVLIVQLSKLVVSDVVSTAT